MSQNDAITVERFYTDHSSALELNLVAGATEKAQLVFGRGRMLGFHAYRQVAPGVGQDLDRLLELQASSPDTEASAVVSVDGLSIASALPQGVEEDRVSAMSAAMLSLGERIASELGRGTLQQVYIKGEKGYVVLMSVGEEAVLTALAREQAKLGLSLLDMRRAVEDLAKLI